MKFVVWTRHTSHRYYLWHKLAKDNNGVKNLLVRQDLFDRTVDAKEMKTKDCKETVRAFLTMITKSNPPKKLGLIRKQNLLESVKNYVKLKENKFTLQWKRPRLHLLNVQYDPWKTYFTVTWKTMDTSTFTNWLIDSNRYNTKFSKKLLDRLDTKECKEFRLFVHSVQQTTTRI